MLSNLILLTCLNRYLLVLCYTIVISSLNRLNDSTSQVASQRSKVESRDARSCVRAPKPQRINLLSVPELVEGRRFIFRLGFRSGFFRVASAEASILDYAESREKTWNNFTYKNYKM